MPVPKRLRQDGRQYLPKRQNLAIKLDTVNPADLRRLDLRFFCEDCSHFATENKTCTMGYLAVHTRQRQLALYDITGKMALCRAIEID